MKALLISFLFLFSYTLTAQNCDPNECVSDVTSEVYTNMACDPGSPWTPDIDICWGKRQFISGYACVILIWNNSSTDTLDVDIFVPAYGVHYLETIDPSSCETIILNVIVDHYVYIEFSSPNHSITCDSRFYMNCT